jgi:hypothetical protein
MLRKLYPTMRASFRGPLHPFKSSKGSIGSIDSIGIGSVNSASSVGQYRGYRSSTKLQNDLIFGGLAVGATAVVAQYALQMYNNRPKTPTKAPTDTDTSDSKRTSKTGAAGAATGAAGAAGAAGAGAGAAEAGAGAGATGAAGAKGESIFAGFETWFARNFYDGGFEEKMTKREAALILGVRESATGTYRCLLILFSYSITVF